METALKKLLKKMAVLSVLLGGFCVSEALSEETNETQVLMSRPLEETKSRQSAPITTETPQPEEKIEPTPSQEVNSESKPKDAATAVHKKKKHKHVAKAKKKPKPAVSVTASAVSKDTKAPISRGHQGWFVGIRGSYVPSVIVEIGYEFNNTFKLRLIGQGGRYYQSYSFNNERFNRIQFQPRKVGVMADWHPWKNGFRLTGGIAYNADRIRLNHTVTNSISGLPASVYGTIAAKYKFRVNVPYLGIGYDTGSLGETGISLSADAGFWFQGQVRSSFTLSGTGQTTPMVIENTRVYLNSLLNKHKLIRTTPMVSLGIRYLF